MVKAEGGHMCCDADSSRWQPVLYQLFVEIGVDVRQSVTYRYREFPVPGIFHLFGGIGTGIGKNWYRKKVSEPVSENFGTGKKYRNRYRKNLVPEKVSEPVSEKFGTGNDFCHQNFGI